MRYIIPCVMLFCLPMANAETESVGSTDSAQNIQQTTQSVAQKLIKLLDLKTVPEAEQGSISLKQVVIKALGEGKQMQEIRQATNEAVKAVTGQSFTAPPADTAQAEVSEQVDPENSLDVAANPAEVTLDPETGKMMAIVLPGESISRLAQRVYGQENGRMYLEIYKANTDKIANINVVVEGQKLIMP